MPCAAGSYLIMEVVFLIWAVVASVAAVLFSLKANAKAAPEALSSGVTKAALGGKTTGTASDDAIKAVEKKLAEARTELTSHKEKLAQKQKELEEIKEQARVKARREGKKEAASAEDKKTSTDPRDVEIQSLRKGMAALESQLNTVKREAAAKDAQEANMTSKSAADVEGAQKVAAGERERRQTLEEQNADLRRTIDELRSAIKKVEARPDIPGTSIDLKALPTPVVQELARFFRKGEEYERLHTVAQSQLQLEKDRTLEIQRRYFAVCRELAVHAGAPGNAKVADVVATAEAIVDGELKIEAKPAEGQATGEKKKRRRRRRRKIAGESSEVAETEGADEGDESDDGDDGDDAGEGHGTDAPAAAAEKAAGPEGDSGASAPA